jgi:hypothetical protein
MRKTTSEQLKNRNYLALVGEILEANADPGDMLYQTITGKHLAALKWMYERVKKEIEK